MRRPAANGGDRSRDGERQVSAAARAAMARAAGQPCAAPPRSSYAATPRRRMRSVFYRAFYGSVISGDPTQQSDKARALFRRSMVGCLILVYVPLMGIGYALVNYASSNDATKRDAAQSSLRSKNLVRRSFPHGSFFFGRTSHEVSNHKTSMGEKNYWNPIQQKMLDDEEIIVEAEKERCERYGLGYTNETLSRRRRMFLGGLIADESTEVLRAIGTEARDVFHTVSYVEGNADLTSARRRDWKYGLDSENLSKLQQAFGPRTKVSVEYYVSASDDSAEVASSPRDAPQREGNNLRWKMNGMTGDDVAVVADADATFSRDFLRALQTCDLPEFRPGQRTCRDGKVSGLTLAFEGSPTCSGKATKGFHPGAMLGECVDQIGDASSRPPAERESRYAMHGNGGEGNSRSDKEGAIPSAGSNHPLWFAADIRASNAGKAYASNTGSVTGYHFHNFFTTSREIRRKYDGLAREAREAHPDLALGVDCALSTRNGNSSEVVGGRSDNAFPIYYLHEGARAARHLQWQNIAKENDEWLDTAKS